MKPEAQPRPRQDLQQSKDALGRTAPKGDVAGSASPHQGCTGALADAGHVNHPTTGENAPAVPCGASLEAWRGSSIAMPCGLSVTILRDAIGQLPASRTVRIRTTCRSKPRRTCRAPSLAAGRWPGRSGNAGSAVFEGRQAARGGDSLQSFPWRQAKRAAPPARRREGLKPNGRDDKDGTGRSPKARRRIAPTRPGRSIFSRRNPRQAHDPPAPTRNPGRHCRHRSRHDGRFRRCTTHQPHRAIRRACLAYSKRTDAFHRGRGTWVGRRPRRTIPRHDHRRPRTESRRLVRLGANLRLAAKTGARHRFAPDGACAVRTAGHAGRWLRAVGRSSVLRALWLSGPCGPATAGRAIRLLQGTSPAWASAGRHHALQRCL